LETNSVPVVGFQTDEFPAFYARSSGLPVSVNVDSVAEIAQMARAHWALGRKSAVLVVVPPPEADALDADRMGQVIQQALDEMEVNKVRGQQVTPFLLSRVSELTDGDSLKANLALLKNNARIAGQIACELARIPSE
jgi:pseudouridine-5'-phosphate glycosidase